MSIAVGLSACHLNIRCCWDSFPISVLCALKSHVITINSEACLCYQEIDTWKAAAAAAMLTCDLPQGRSLRHTDCNANDQPTTTLDTSHLLFLTCPESQEPSELQYPWTASGPSAPFQPTATIPGSMVRGPFPLSRNWYNSQLGFLIRIMATLFG